MQPIFLSRTLPKLFAAGLLLMFDAPLVMAQPAPQILQSPANRQLVFLVDAKGMKRQFRNFEVFTGCGLNPSSMRLGDPLKLARMRVGPPLNTPDDCKAALAQLGVAIPGGGAAPIATPSVPVPPAPPEPPTVGKAPPPLPATIRNAIVKFVGLLPVGDKAQQEAMVKGVLDKMVMEGRWAVAKHEGVEVYAYYGSADPTHQMVVVAFNSSTAIKAPRLFSKEVMDRLGNTAFRDVMISYSLQDEEVKQAAKKSDDTEMPAGMKALMQRSYFNPSSFEFKAGVQLSANVTLSGVFNDLLVAGMGVRAPNGAPQFVLKAGMTLDLPSVPDNETKGDKARASLEYTKKLQDDAEAAKKKAAGQPEEPDLPEFFAELQMGPGVTANGPMGLTNFQLANGTFVVSTKGPKIDTVGYQGNININMPGGPKSFLGFFEGPVDAGGAWDVLEAKFGLATPTLGLGDMAYLSFFAMAPAPASPASKNGGPLAKLQPFKDAAGKMYEPLNAVQVKNPGGVPPYVAGGGFPEPEEFNLVILGPLATMGEAKGPLVRLVGDAEVLGSNWGKINATFSESGLEAKANGSVSLAPVSGVKLGQLRAATDVKIDAKDQRVKLNGDIEIAGVGRTAELNIQPKQIAFLSKPQGAGNCVLPVDISASINAPNPGDIARFRLANLAQNIQFPDPASLGSAGQGVANCAGFVWAQLKAGGKIIGSAAVVAGNAIADGGKEVGKRTVEGGKFVYKWGKSVFGGNDPARPAYDCTDAGLDSPETVTAHPPSRLWGARDEYERGKSSGAWARYIFSEKTGKFHPFGAKGALGATACGGLVGETGVGLGRFASDNEIWDKAVMCHTIPASMKGEPFTTPDQCYELRGASAPPRQAVLGNVIFAVNGYNFIVGKDGRKHQLMDWNKLTEFCGLKPAEAIRVSLHELYGISLGEPMVSRAQCLQLAAGTRRAEPSIRGRIVTGTDGKWYMLAGDGRRRWLTSMDVVNACGPWRPGWDQPLAMGDALAFIEEAEPATTGVQCVGWQSLDHINHRQTAIAAQRLLDQNVDKIKGALDKFKKK